MPDTDVSSYPWQSEAVFVAELDADGMVVSANPAMRQAWGAELEGLPFSQLLAGEQASTFQRRLEQIGSEWVRTTFGFLGGGDGAEDRCLWLRRLPGGEIEVVAEPAWRERDRLVEQVLQLNDDLINTQRSAARRQRDLEHAQEQAARSAHRIRQLEAILLAGLTPRDFGDALQSLLRIAQELLPGDRADILLVDDSGDWLDVQASAGPGTAVEGHGYRIGVGDGVLGKIAGSGTSVLVEDLQTSQRRGVPARQGSLIGAPLRLDEQVIGVLAVSASAAGCFSEVDLRLLELVGERVALAIGQAQIRDREQRMAETLQRTLLPQSLPQLARAEIGARYLPHTASVGGDFYDAIAHDDGTLGLAIGDVTGKGLRAAAAMSRLRNALHAYALDSSEPSEVLTRLGRLAQADDAIATALYLVLDPATGRVDVCSAGHLPPLLIPGDGSARYVDVHEALSAPLGLAVPRRPQVRVELQVGEMLLLYTDGLVERTRNIDHGMERLAQAAAQDPRAAPDDLCEHLLTALAPGGRYRDDVAIVAVRRTG